MRALARPRPLKPTSIRRRTTDRRHPIPRIFTTPLDLASIALDPIAAIEKLAESALFVILREREKVNVRVDGALAEVLSGSVRGAKISGTSWASPKRLTCREITLEVGACEVDPGAVLALRGIVFKRPASGRARLTFDSVDWGNFLTHDVFKAYVRKVGTDGLTFEGGSSASVTTDGRLAFVASWRHERWRCELEARDNNEITMRCASANGSTSDEETARALERELETFFERLVVELDGSELKYAGMRVDGARGRADFTLDLVVNRFPNPVTARF